MADLKVLSEADVKILQEVIANAKRGRLNSLPSPQPDLDLSSAAPETYIAYGSVPGLTAGVGTAPAVPGVSTCVVYQIISGELIPIEGLSFTVYNLQEEAVSGYFSIHRSKLGQWLAVVGTCCLVLCCNLKVGVSDTVLACQCSVNAPLYKPSPHAVYLTSPNPLATRDYVLDQDGIGYDGESIRSVDYLLGNDNMPSGYQAFGANYFPEPVSVLRWGLDFNQQRQVSEIIEITPDDVDTLVTSTDTVIPTITYRGVQIDDQADNVGEFFDSLAFLDRNPQGAYAGPVKQFLYYCKTSDTRLVLYENPSDPSPNQAFYDDFSILELEINIDEDAEITLAVPPATQPVNWGAYPEIERTEDLYKVPNGEGWLGFLQPECLRMPLEYTGTAEPTGSPVNPETVTVRGLSPDGSRSKAWTTVVVEGQTYTCKWIAGYDGETLEEVLAETPMIQAQLFMLRYDEADPLSFQRVEGGTIDQFYRQPFLSGSPQYQGATPTTIPQSRWHPVKAWVGAKADEETGTAIGTSTGTGDNAWILPNGIDWRKVCLVINPFDDQPLVSTFEDNWTPYVECLDIDFPNLCSDCVESGSGSA